MKIGLRVSYRFLATVGVLAILAAPPAPAATNWALPRTSDGQPDLQGVWLSNGATPLERPKGLEGRPFLTDAEVAELKKRAARLFKEANSDFASGDNAFLAAYANVNRYENPNISQGSTVDMVDREFDNRTSLIVDPPDGKLPPLTPAGLQRVAKADAATKRPPAGPEDFTNFIRCITFGTPRVGGNFGAGPYSYYQIFQTAGYVVLFTEMIHEARIIPLDGRPHIPQSIRQWSGDSRGRWEKKTLVVDTTNLATKNYYMGSAENLHLVERFTRVSADRLDYTVTIDDPTTWTKPWTAVVRLKATKDAIYEFACHEGNYVSMVGMLSGTK